MGEAEREARLPGLIVELADDDDDDDGDTFEAEDDLF